MSRKRGLGRGLDALLPPAEETAHNLPVARLRPNRLQPRSRFDDEGLDELADSIRTQGLVQPILVTPAGDGTYTIVAGERRWRAAQRAGLGEVPVVVRQLDDESQLLELALVENLQRADLDPLEEAEAYQRLQESFGLSQEEVGRRVGKSRVAVANALRLLRLPADVQEHLRAGRLSAGQARPLLALEDDEERSRLAERAVREGLSARALERLVQRPRGAGERSPRQRDVDVHAAAAEERLTRRLQTRVEIRRRGPGGHIRLYFHSEEELMRLFELLTQAPGGRS